MAYWTLDGLYGVLSEDQVLPLVDDDSEGDIVQSPPNAAYSRIAAAGARADTLIDTYLRGHYSVPLSPVPDIIRDVACSLTAYELYAVSDNDVVPEKIKDRRSTAINLLEHVRGDKIRLFDEAEAARTIQVNKQASDRVFPSSVLDQF